MGGCCHREQIIREISRCVGPEPRNAIIWFTWTLCSKKHVHLCRILLADSQTTGPFSSHKERWIRKEALCIRMSSSCFLYSFHYFSIFIHFPWRVMLQPPVFITMSRGSKLSVSSITGSSAVATNSFTPQVEDSSGLTPWRPQLEASHPAAKLSRWRSSSDLGTDLVVESSIMRLHSAPGMKEPFVPLFSKVTLQAWTRMFAKRSTSHSYEFVGDLWLVTLWWKRCCYVPNNKLLLCFNFMVWSRYSKICKMLNVYPYRLFYHPPPQLPHKTTPGWFP